MTTLAGAQVVGVTALTTLAVFEDMYLEYPGDTYNPAAKGERGYMKRAAAILDNGVNSMSHELNTPLEIEAAVAAAVRSGPDVPQPVQQAQAKATLDIDAQVTAEVRVPRTNVIE